MTPTSAGLPAPAPSSPDVLDRVRTLVRERGTDPLADPRAVRAAILDVLDEVATSETEREVAEVEAWAREIHDLVAGYGPLQRLFDDPDVEELWWNEPGRVFCARRGRTELTTVVLTEVQVHDLVERMLRTSGRRVDVSQPFVDALLPDGSRLHVVIPDVTRRHWAVNVRRHVLPASRLEDLVAIGTLTPGAARFLTAAVVAGLNIVVAGGTQAGKTTLLSCLLNAVPAGERVVTGGGGVRAAARPARLGGDADPAGRPRGHGRDHPAAPRGRGAADATQPARGRRGAAGGGARSPGGVELRHAGDDAACTPTPRATPSSSSACSRCSPART